VGHAERAEDDSNEARRLYGVIDKRLASSRYLAADQYTIADIAVLPWLRSWKNQGIELDDYPAQYQRR